jgi:hypothetical protein
VQNIKVKTVASDGWYSNQGSNPPSLDFFAPLRGNYAPGEGSSSNPPPPLNSPLGGPSPYYGSAGFGPVSPLGMGMASSSYGGFRPPARSASQSNSQPYSGGGYGMDSLPPFPPPTLSAIASPTLLPADLTGLDQPRGRRRTRGAGGLSAAAAQLPYSANRNRRTPSAPPSSDMTAFIADRMGRGVPVGSNPLTGIDSSGFGVFRDPAPSYDPDSSPEQSRSTGPYGANLSLSPVTTFAPLPPPPPRFNPRPPDPVGRTSVSSLGFSRGEPPARPRLERTQSSGLATGYSQTTDAAKQKKFNELLKNNADVLGTNLPNNVWQFSSDPDKFTVKNISSDLFYTVYNSPGIPDAKFVRDARGNVRQTSVFMSLAGLEEWDRKRRSKLSFEPGPSAPPPAAAPDFGALLGEDFDPLSAHPPRHLQEKSNDIAKVNEFLNKCRHLLGDPPDEKDIVWNGSKKVHIIRQKTNYGESFLYGFADCGLIRGAQVNGIDVILNLNTSGWGRVNTNNLSLGIGPGVRKLKERLKNRDIANSLAAKKFLDANANILGEGNSADVISMTTFNEMPSYTWVRKPNKKLVSAIKAGQIENASVDINPDGNEIVKLMGNFWEIKSPLQSPSYRLCA